MGGALASSNCAAGPLNRAAPGFYPPETKKTLKTPPRAKVDDDQVLDLTDVFR